MTTRTWKQKLINSSLVLGFAATIGVTQIAAASINDTGLEVLGITEVQYEEAKDEAKEAYINELADLGWITDAEAAEAIEEGERIRLGRSQYYKGIVDKEALLADALGVTEAQLDAAQEASFDAKLAERIEEGRLTAEEAADKEAIHDFKQSIDKDEVLAEALGISVAELDAYRASNTDWNDVLDDLGLTSEDVRDEQQAIKQDLIDDAVDNGTLTEEQAEQAANGRGGRGGNGGERPARGNGGGNAPEAPDNA